MSTAANVVTDLQAFLADVDNFTRHREYAGDCPTCNRRMQYLNGYCRGCGGEAVGFNTERKTPTVVHDFIVKHLSADELLTLGSLAAYDEYLSADEETALIGEFNTESVAEFRRKWHASGHREPGRRVEFHLITVIHD
jgi:uncharacterized OB-fold protein